MNPSQCRHEQVPNQNDDDRISQIEVDFTSETLSSEDQAFDVGATARLLSSSKSSSLLKQAAEKEEIDESIPPNQPGAMLMSSTPPSEGVKEGSSIDTLIDSEKLNRHRKDFPWKLHCMLEEAEKYSNQHIVSWQPDGLAFRVLRPDDFVNKIMPHYFHQTQYRSFQRMLNLYEFQKILSGPNRGSYKHPNFIQRDRSLCLHMRIRKRIKPKMSDGSMGYSPKSAKKRQAILGSDFSVLQTTAAAAPDAGRVRQLQLERGVMVGASGTTTSRAMYQHNAHLRHESGDQTGPQQFQRQQQNDDMTPSTSTNMTSMEHDNSDPTTSFSYAHKNSTLTTSVATPGGWAYDQSFSGFRQPQRKSESEERESAQPVHDMGHNYPQHLRNSVPTTTTALNFLPAAWDTTVTGPALFGDYENMDETINPLVLSNRGAPFRFPTKVATRHAALAGTTRNEPFHEVQRQQQQLQQGQPTDEGQHSQVADSQLFQLPLCSDLEPTPLPH